MSVIELRQYTLLPGRREDLIRLFEDHLTRGQVECGIDVIGTFRDLADPTRFVWIRAFPDMRRRQAALRAFYGGPVWQRWREAANATMVDSDNVLLLRPATGEAAFPCTSSEFAPGKTQQVQAGIVGLAEPATEGDIAYFDGHLAPLIEADGGWILGRLVSEGAENNFPALPVREGENVLVWLAGFPNPAASQQGDEPTDALAEALGQWPAGTLDAEILSLAPTRHSLLGSGADPPGQARASA